MPLPQENVEWPPDELKTALKVISEWDLWYGGDVDAITRHFEDNDITAEGSRSWRFWARRRPTTSSNARREKLHVPLAGDIASTSADMLFAAPVDILIPGARDTEEGELAATQSRLDEISEQGGLLNRLLEAAEEASALGGVYLRPTWDRAVADHPILTHVTPERAVPVFRFGLLTEVTFTKILSEEDEKVVWRHLEHHSVDSSDRAVIENALYEGTEDKIGQRRDLEHHPWTADLEDLITLPIDGLAVRYVKNMGPARRLRGSHHGRSDFDGIEPLFDAVDETWNSWMRDLRLGKARLLVPAEYLERSTPGRGSYFDTDQELFSPLEMGPDERQNASITEVQFKIRFEEHKATVESLVMEAVGKAGYSAQTFGFHTGDSRGEATATEIRARESKTLRTTAKKRRYWEPASEDVLEVMLAIDREMLGNTKTKVIRPDIEWPDLAAPDAHHLAETIAMLAQAEAASTETLVRMQHPEWSESEILAEVEKIASSRPAPLPNPFDMGPEEVPDDEEEMEE